MQVVVNQNVKGSFSRTTESGHNREVVALYRWSLEQVPHIPYAHYNIMAMQY